MSLSDRARALRSQIIDTVVRQNDPQLAKELEADDDNNNINENSQSQKKWIVGEETQGICRTCEFVSVLQKCIVVVDEGNLSSSSSSPSMFQTHLKNLIDLLSVSAMTPLKTQQDHNPNSNTSGDDKNTTNSTNNKNNNNSPITLLKSVPHCQNHSDLLWSSTSPPRTNWNRVPSTDRFFEILTLVVAGCWGEIWRKYLKTMIPDSLGERKQQSSSSTNSILGVSLLINRQASRSSKKINFSEIFKSETELFLGVIRFLNSFLPSSSQLRVKIISFLETKFTNPMLSLVESAEIFRMKIHERQITTKNNNNNEFRQYLQQRQLQFFSWIAVDLLEKLEYSIVFESHHRQLSSMYYQKSSSSADQQHHHSQNEESSNKSSSQNLHFRKLKTNIEEIIKLIFRTENLYGTPFMISLNAQYSKLVDASSKFWGSHVKNIVVTKNQIVQDPKQYDENDFVLISHPIQWFLEDYNESDFHSKSKITNKNNCRRIFSREILLWIRDWMFLSPVNKFGMSQKFADVLWIVKNVIIVASDDGQEISSSSSSSIQQQEQQDLVVEIICCALLHFLPIEMLAAGYDRRTHEEQEGGQDEAEISMRTKKKDIFEKFINNSKSNGSNDDDAVLLSSSGIVQISKNLFPKSFQEQIVSSSLFWEIVGRDVHVQFQNHHSAGDKKNDQQTNRKNNTSSTIISLPSLKALQSFDSTSASRIVFQSKAFNERITVAENKVTTCSCYSALQYLLLTRFEAFDQTYPPPTEEDKKAFDTLVEKVF